MRVIFCNIAWMKYYDGVTEDDLPFNGGSWVNEQSKEDLLYGGLREGCNFTCNPDGYCYGDFRMSHRDDKMNLKRIDSSVSNGESCIFNVLVIWTATRPSGGRYIVGWYKDATVYREDTFDRDGYCYRVKSRCENCYCIPEDKRDFRVYSARQIGKGNGFGQSNVWYADQKAAFDIKVGQRYNAVKYIENFNL